MIADDHPVFLDGLRLLLDTAPGIEVVGTAADGAQLLEVAGRTAVDVVVADLDMPGLDGAAAARALLANRSDVAVLVLTMHDDDTSVRRALAAGARGYVLKGAAPGSIVRAVHAVAEGDTVLNGDVGARVLRAAADARGGAGTTAPPPGLASLTVREAEVLELVAQGLGNHAIAGRLHLSVKTVQNRVSDLLAKTGAASRAELVARARDAGMGGRA
ncbi:response regulator transcription factor [Isoptericola variabilis]|uniref:response regulator n=1 Tax=Isoptericola variabilis TaxID=139208 RepID=UPI001C8F33A0|nr:response regulator transcription factor [Isoptericola variabilis]